MSKVSRSQQVSNQDYYARLAKRAGGRNRAAIANDAAFDTSELEAPNQVVSPARMNPTETSISELKPEPKLSTADQVERNKFLAAQDSDWLDPFGDPVIEKPFDRSSINPEDWKALLDKEHEYISEGLAIDTTSDS